MEDEKFISNHTKTEKKVNQLRDFYINAKWFYVALAIGLFLSLVNLVIAIIVSVKFTAYSAGWIAIFGGTSALIFGFGFWAVRNYSNACERESLTGDFEKMESLDQSIDRTLFDAAIQLILFLFVIFLIFTIGCFAFQTDAQKYVEGLSRNKDDWFRYFGDRTYKSISENVNTYLNVAGFFALLLTFACLSIAVIAFKSLGTYRFTQTLVEFICSTFFYLGLVFLYLGVYARNYRELTKVDKAMPEWVPDALMITAVITCVAAVAGYIFSKYEMKKYLKYFAYGSAVFTIILIFFGLSAAMFTSRFQQYFDNKCSSVLEYMNESFLKDYMKCNQKYIFTSASLDNMSCPKNRIVSAWELNLGKNIEDQVDYFGCLDNNCCLQTYSSIKTNVDYMALISFILFLLGVILVVCTYFMYSKLESGEEHAPQNIKITKDDYASGILAAIGLALCLYAIFTLPRPAGNPILSYKINKSNNIEDITLDFSINANISEITRRLEVENDEKAREDTSILENTKNCNELNNCPKLKYTYDIVTNDGAFALAEHMKNLKVEMNKKEDNAYWLKMNGDDSTLNYFINSFTFTPTCLLTKSRLRMRVNAEAVSSDTILLQKNSMSFAQLKQDNQELINPTNEQPASSNNQVSAAYNIDLSKINVGDKFQIFDKMLDYSIISEKDIVIVKGRVLQLFTPTTNNTLPNAKITLTSLDFPGCSSIEIISDVNGLFTSPEIYLIKGDYVLQFSIKVSSDKLSTFEKTFSIGGLGYSSVIDFGDIALYDPSLNNASRLSTLIINSIDNTPLSGVKVKLYQGYVKFDERSNQQSPTPSFIQIAQDESKKENDKPLQEILTSKDGNVILSSVPFGSYTLVFEKQGFYREVQCKYSLI
jgi:hypothetical protein